METESADVLLIMMALPVVAICSIWALMYWFCRWVEKFAMCEQCKGDGDFRGDVCSECGGEGSYGCPSK